MIICYSKQVPKSLKNSLACLSPKEIVSHKQTKKRSLNNETIRQDHAKTEVRQEELLASLHQSIKPEFITGYNRKVRAPSPLSPSKTNNNKIPNKNKNKNHTKSIEEINIDTIHLDQSTLGI